MKEFDKEYAEGMLRMLEERSFLFPQFVLAKQNNELKLLGTGGFSSIYEMQNIECPDNCFALKVVGFGRHTISTEEFTDTLRIQWILSNESPYIMRILDSREVLVSLDENGKVTDVRNAQKEVWEENNNSLLLQFVLMEKLDVLIEKDRFGKISLMREELKGEAEVIKFAIEIGQALACAHNNSCLHRDVKLENIFWDNNEKIYKLGDFGNAKWSENGTAETVIYTDGYCAPEIERRRYDSYNATADIYSFGITLYLLLNDLRFPGSNDYHSKAEIQYNPEFVFPAPVHASKKLAEIIRKMCSFYPEDRYRSMSAVLTELAALVDRDGEETTEELAELADMVTVTYREEDDESDESIERANCSEEKKKTRAERKLEAEAMKYIYREYNIKFGIVLVLLMTLMLKLLQTDSSMIFNRWFFILPAAVLLEALLQKIEELHLIFGTAIIVFAVFSIVSVGLSIPHILLIACVLLGCPLLSLTGATATGIWMLTELTDKLKLPDFIVRLDLGWILLAAVAVVIHRYFSCRLLYGRISYIRAYVEAYVYDKIYILMLIIGIVLWILSKNNIVSVPDIVDRMHFIRVGIVSTIIMGVFSWHDGAYEHGYLDLLRGE